MAGNDLRISGEAPPKDPLGVDDLNVEAPTLADGLVAGRYRIRERIARGGQATVYLAT